MECDGKAVGFLLNGADQRENCLVGINGDLLRLGGDQRSGSVPVILDHAKHRERKPQLLQGAFSDPGVVDTAVDQKESGRFAEALVPCLVMSKAPHDNLTHGGVIVLILKALQLKTLVVALPWFPVLKYHHAGDDIRT